MRSVAVIGLPDAVLGERPAAYIVLTEDMEASDDLEAALRASCAERLPRPKQPGEFCFMDQLPLGRTGKISRRLLKDLVAAQS